MLQITLDRPAQEIVLDRQRLQITLGRDVLRMEIPGTSDAPEPEPEYFYGVSGGLVRYDARTLDLADGGAVAAWSDASGQLGAAEQDAVARQPTYTAALPGVRFPGGGEHHLRLPVALQISGDLPIHIFVLVTREVRNLTGEIVGWGGGVATMPYGIFTISSNRGTYLAGGNQWGSANDAWPNGLGIVEMQNDGTDSDMTYQGIVIASGPRGADPAPTVEPPSLGAQLRADGSVGFPFQGIIHDVLFFDRALSPAELATVRAGIASDWGI